MSGKKSESRVVNCKKDDFDVYIGTPSKWENPFEIGRDGKRSEVLQKYKNYILNNKDLLADLDELRGKTLGCWCSPKPCHGDILIKLISQLDENE
jgi:hypothetical protein